MDRLKRARDLIADGDYSRALREYETVNKNHPDYEKALCGIALVHLLEGRLVETTKCMTDVLKVQPKTAYPYGILGAIASEVSTPDYAVALYEAAISADPSEAATYVRKAHILCTSGLEKEGTEVIRKCAKVANLKVDTPMAADRLNAIFESVDAGQQPAIRLVDSAVFVPGLRTVLDRVVGDELHGSNPTDLDAIRLGGIDEKIEAIEKISKEIKSHPDHHALCMMGVFLYDVGRTSESMVCYERAIKEDPGNMQYYGHKLVVLQDIGDEAGITECVYKALKATPKDEYHAKVQRNMRLWRDITNSGETNQFAVAGVTRATKWHIARRKYIMSDQAYSSPRTAKSGRGSIHIPANTDTNYDAARKDSPRGRAGAQSTRRPKSKQPEPTPIGTENIDALLARAAKMAADGKPNNALREYKKAEKQVPLDERVLCGMTLVHMWRGHGNKAREYVKKLCEARPDAAYPHGIAGMQWDEWWMQSVSLAFGGFSYGGMIEELRWRMHDVGVEYYDKMLAVDPGEVSAYVRKALILHFKGMEKECADTIKECLGAHWSGRESPKEKRRLREMGQSIEKNGRVVFKSHDSATFLPGLWEMLDIAFGPDQASLSRHDESNFEGFRLVGEGDLQECLEEVEQAIKSRPRSTTPWYAKGEILAEGGRIDEAVACYERVAEIEPDEMQAYLRKARLLADARYAKGALECLKAALYTKPRDEKQLLFKDDMVQALEWLETVGEWPPTRSSRIIGDIVRWAAGRRSKLASFGKDSEPEGPLFPPGMIDKARADRE